MLIISMVIIENDDIVSVLDFFISFESFVVILVKSVMLCVKIVETS
jgi:hypothetical protein